MKVTEKLISFGFIVFCIVYYLQSITFTSSWRIYPQIFIIMLFILSLINVLKSKKDNGKVIFKEPINYKVVIVALSTLIYIFLLNIIGFYILTPMFLIFILAFLGIRDIKTMFITILVFIITIYLGFSMLLSVKTP